MALYSSSTKLKLPTLYTCLGIQVRQSVTLSNAAWLSRPTGKECPAF